MPVTYRYDSNLIILELAGEYSTDDIRSVLKASLADPSLPAKPRLLIDFSSSQSLSKRSSSNIMAMAQFIASLSEKFSRRLAVVAPKDYQYGIVRMGASVPETQGIDFKIFRSFDEAHTWLSEPLIGRR